MAVSAGRPTGLRWPRGLRVSAGLQAVALAGATAVLYALFHQSSAGWPAAWTTGFQTSLNAFDTWVANHNNTSPVFVYGFNPVGAGLTAFVNDIYRGLNALTWPGLTAVGGLVALRFVGTRVAAVVVGSFFVYGTLGLWQLSLVTLALILGSVLLALAVGLPLGIAAGLSDRVLAGLTPLLDAMQVMPAFAYLMPVVLFFGVGSSAAIVVTVIFAIPPAVRVTALGIRGVPAGPVEAARSQGTTRRQLLTKVQLPLARRTLMVGVNQVIMLALSMVVIASVIAAGGLGDPVLAALTVVKVGDALVPGVAIVVMAIALDRLTMGLGRTRAASGRSRLAAKGASLRGRRGLVVTAGGTLALLGLVLAFRAAGFGTYPPGWVHSFAQPVNGWANSFQQSVNLQGVSDAFVRYLLNPVQNTLQAAPWWLVIGVAATVGWRLAGVRLALTAVAALVVIGLVGVWSDSMGTLAQVVVATAITVVIGLVLGVLSARKDWVHHGLRPLLDAMQTMPSFVYLVPVIALFGVGETPAAVAAIVYALPVVIRLTDSGLRQVSPLAKEAALASGAGPWQMLAKVELPMARPSLLLAVNQGTMYVLAMVIIGALVGGGALGYDVLVGLSQNKLGLGMAAGVALVCLGILLDRLAQAAAARSRTGSSGR